MDLSQLQHEHRLWVEHNFSTQESWEPLLGLMEEVGELSHAHLKYSQDIRGYDHDKYWVEATDAVGDIVIYLASYCTVNRFDLGACVRRTWHQVKARDWIKFPENGVDK